MPLHLRSTDELYTFAECPFRWRARYFVGLVTRQDAVEWAMDMLSITILRWPLDGREAAWEHVEERLRPIDPKQTRLAALRALSASWQGDILAEANETRPGINGAVRVAGGNCRVPFAVLGFMDGDAVAYCNRRSMESVAPYWLPAVTLTEARDHELGEECPPTAVFIRPTWKIPHATINDRGASANLPAKDPAKHSDQETLLAAIVDTEANADEYAPIVNQLPPRWAYLAHTHCVELDADTAKRRMHQDVRNLARMIQAAMRESKCARTPGRHCNGCPYQEPCAERDDRMKHWPGYYILPQSSFTWETWGKALEALS